MSASTWSDAAILDVIKEALAVADPERRRHFDRLDPAWTIEEIGGDSILTVEMVNEVERRTNVQIPDEALLSVRVVGDVVALVQRQLGGDR